MTTAKWSKAPGEDAARPTTLLKALQVLSVLSDLECGRGVTLQQITDATSESKSSVHRWLQAFREFGMVDQDESTERYHLGLRLLQFSSRLLANMDLRREAIPILQDLMVRSSETVHMGVYDHGEVVYLDKIDGPGSFLMRSRIGGRMQCHCTALGKALLAHMPASEVQSVIEKGLPARMPNTITDPILLLQNLEEIRLRGYSIDNEENESDIICVAATAFDYLGKPAAAMSVSALASRMPRERIVEMGLAVREATERLSARLGYQPATSIRLQPSSSISVAKPV